MAGELISREALDRIIQRAAELQTGERDIGEGLTETKLVALGNDVGIPARYLKQALLEERTRTPGAERARRWSLVGPGAPRRRTASCRATAAASSGRCRSGWRIRSCCG